jgi:hypothetical protein
MSTAPTQPQYGAVLDANVLVPVALCDMLLRLAAEHFYSPYWSEQILAENEHALVEQLDIARHSARHRIGQMRAAFPEAMVQDA